MKAFELSSAPELEHSCAVCGATKPSARRDEHGRTWIDVDGRKLCGSPFCSAEYTRFRAAARMPEPDLAAIKARLAAATPGPWTVRTDHDGEYEEDHAHVDGAGGEAVALVEFGEADEADADLIAHAPTDLATLIAEVERLRAIEAAARHMLQFHPHSRGSVINALRAALEAK